MEKGHNPEKGRYRKSEKIPAELLRMKIESAINDVSKANGFKFTEYRGRQQTIVRIRKLDVTANLIPKNWEPKPNISYKLELGENLLPPDDTRHFGGTWYCVAKDQAKDEGAQSFIGRALELQEMSAEDVATKLIKEQEKRLEELRAAREKDENEQE